ncbi:MAG TPA: hypothetical protein VFV66_24405 [Nonomuraea sp.]|nr:hypothetical protein [Nonomuraea sp.]
MSRSAGADVTLRRQAGRIPEFRDVEEQPDGTWTAVHNATGETITAETFERLERVQAPMVRLAHALRGAS